MIVSVEVLRVVESCGLIMNNQYVSICSSRYLKVFVEILLFICYRKDQQQFENLEIRKHTTDVDIYEL